MNRRDLLHSADMARTAGMLLGPWLQFAHDEADECQELSLLRFSQRAMATLFEVMFPMGRGGAAELASRVFEQIEQLEAQMTVYREDSEISLLNQHAFTQTVSVEAQLFGLLSLATQIHRETNGAFDITAGPLIKAWGFFRRQGRVPTPEERQESLSRVGMRWVELDQARRSVRFRRPNMEINLGSIGKGYALDRVAKDLRAQGVDAALLHGGGSSVFALGAQPNEPRGWPVGIRHPWHEGESLGLVYLKDQALGTSAATHQHLEYNHRKLGHLLDPRTGWPAEAVASASAIASSAAEADALATAFFVLGIDKTRLYCQTHPGIGAILLPNGVDARPVVFGVAQQIWSPATPLIKAHAP
jgi:thiamine biosynthesis lipoprotein